MHGPKTGGRVWPAGCWAGRAGWWHCAGPAVGGGNRNISVSVVKQKKKETCSAERELLLGSHRLCHLIWFDLLKTRHCGNRVSVQHWLFCVRRDNCGLGLMWIHQCQTNPSLNQVQPTQRVTFSPPKHRQDEATADSVYQNTRCYSFHCCGQKLPRHRDRKRYWLMLRQKNNNTVLHRLSLNLKKSLLLLLE